MLNLMLCGPITGDLDKDFEIFKPYEDLLRESGFNVVNPVRLLQQLKDTPPEQPEGSNITQEQWNDFFKLRRCLDALVFVQGIYLMGNWNHQPNSIIMVLAAQIMKLKAYTHNQDGDLISIGFICMDTTSDPDESDSDEKQVTVFKQAKANASVESEDADDYLSEELTDFDQEYLLEIGDWFDQQIKKRH